MKPGAKSAKGRGSVPAGPPARRLRGFEPAAGLLRDRIRHAGEKRGFAVARLLTHWAEIVGEEIAAHARPVRIAYGRARARNDPARTGPSQAETAQAATAQARGRQPGAAPDATLGATLTLLVSGAMAPVVQMQLPAIRERVNACYGYNAISRILVTQTSAEAGPGAAFAGAAGPGGFAEPGAPFAAAAARPGAGRADPAVAARAEAAAEGIADPGLRAALELLAGNVLSRGAAGRAARAGYDDPSEDHGPSADQGPAEDDRRAAASSISLSSSRPAAS